MNALTARPIRAVLFDLDGTLVDSAGDLRNALNAVLTERGLRSLSLDEVKGMIGDGATKLVERGLAATGGDPATLMETHRAFIAIYEANASSLTRPYPGAVETLKALQAKGLPLAVVTNKPPPRPPRCWRRSISPASSRSSWAATRCPSASPIPPRSCMRWQASASPLRRRSWSATIITT